MVSGHVPTGGVPEADLLPPHSADLPRHGSYGDRRPVAGRRPIVLVLATNRNGGKLRLNASRAGREGRTNRWVRCYWCVNITSKH